MVFFQPRANALRNASCQLAHFIGFTVRGHAGGVVFAVIAALSECVEAGKGVRIKANGQGQTLQRVIVHVAGLCRTVAGRRERGLRGLKCGVVRDIQPPVRAEIVSYAVVQVAFDDGEESGDFLTTCLVRL